MRKIFIFLMLTIFATIANAANPISNISDMPDVDDSPKKEKGWSGLVGLAGASIPEYSGAKDTEGGGIPLIVVDYNDQFYFKVNRLGVWFLKLEDSKFRIGAVIKPRKGYESGDSDALDGMADRDSSTEAGLNFEWKFGKSKLSGMFLTDVSDETEGDSASLTYDYNFIANKELVLMGRLGIENISEEIVSYYYGVSPAEATASRSAYIGDSESITSIGLVAMYVMDPEWLLIGGAVVQQFGDEIKNSPIVEEDSNTTVFVGAAYKF